MTPSSLPKALYFKRDERLTVWKDLVSLVVNPAELFPKRPGEATEVYEYRLTSFNPNFPFKYCLELSEAALNNQRLFSHNEQVQGYLSEMGSFVSEFSHTLLGAGEVYVLAVWSKEGTGLVPKPIIVPSSAVRACSDDGNMLMWSTCERDILNLETYECESWAYLWLYQDGELSKYQAPMKVTPNRDYRTKYTGYQGLNLEVIEGDSFKRVKGYPIKEVPKPIHCKVYEPNPSNVISYLRVKLAWLDTINATGYIQRYLKPSQDNSLDLPVDLGTVDTGNNYLIEADSFGFAEMSGATVNALITSITLLATEQLQVFGLDLSNSVTQSGEAIEADSGRFKQVVDSIGVKVRETFAQLLKAYYPNLQEPQLQGLDDYQVANTSGVIALAKSALEMLRLSQVVVDEVEVALIQGVVRSLLGDLSPAELERIVGSVKIAKPISTDVGVDGGSKGVGGGSGEPKKTALLLDNVEE